MSSRKRQRGKEGARLISLRCEVKAVKLREKFLIALIVLALGLLVYRVADGLMSRALLNAARPAAAYSVDARLFDGG